MKDLKYLFIMLCFIFISKCSSIKVTNSKIDICSVNDSIMEHIVNNKFYIADTISINNPIVLIYDGIRYLTNDSTIIRNHSKSKLDSITYNYNYYKWPYYTLGELLPDAKEKYYPINLDRHQVELPKMDTIFIAFDHSIRIFKIEIDSMRFFLGFLNVFYEESLKSHTIGQKKKRKATYKHMNIFVNDIFDTYTRVVVPIDYGPITYWQYLYNNRHNIDDYIQNSNFLNPIERYRMILSLDSSLLHYSKIPKDYYDSVARELSKSPIYTP